MFFKIRKLISNHNFFTSYIDKCYVRGIQRSGTNFLEKILENKKIQILNYGLINKKNNIKHKHFRVQDEKNSIFMSDEYINSIYINKLEDLNESKEQNKNIIIFKDPINWIVSINDWAIKCKWIKNNENVFLDKYFYKYLKEWDCFHSKWHYLASKYKKNILMIQWEKILYDDIKIIEKLNNFFDNKLVFSKKDFLIENVNLSQIKKNKVEFLRNIPFSEKKKSEIYNNLNFKHFKIYND
tara:strand:- start:4357 stop:5076 length:720 start_codon:yes stop_codon:yes gene_type:complete